MASEAAAPGSPRQRSPTQSPQQSPREQAPAADPEPRAPDPPPAEEDVTAPPEPPAAVAAAPPATTEVSVAGEEPEAKPLERQLIKREVVRVEAAWLKRKKGNPNLNPRGFQVICTLSGGMDPATAKKASIGSKPPPLIKDQREPPFKSIAVDVKEFPDAYMFVADVPGLRNTDIKIDVVNDRFMTISGGRSRNDEPGAYYISLERTMGKFIRKFQLPGNSNLDAMRAGCQDGVLTIFVPMAPPLAEPVVRPVLDVAWDRRKSKG